MATVAIPATRRRTGSRWRAAWRIFGASCWSRSKRRPPERRCPSPSFRGCTRRKARRADRRRADAPPLARQKPVRRLAGFFVGERVGAVPTGVQRAGTRGVQRNTTPRCVSKRPGSCAPKLTESVVSMLTHHTSHVRWALAAGYGLVVTEQRDQAGVEPPGLTVISGNNRSGAVGSARGSK